MRYLVKSLCFVGVVASFSTPLQSFADNASKNKEIAERFSKCDLNKDGRLTVDEAKGCMPRIYSHFSYIDSQNKGYVTLAEIQAIADR